MTNIFNSESALFMGAQRDPQDCVVGIFGVPYDGTTSFRPGTRFGPSAIRENSIGLETYCPELDCDLAEIKFADLGSLEITHGSPEPIIKAVTTATLNVIQLGLKPLIIGGEHSITSGAISALTQNHNDLILVQLDAHADLRETWLGSKFNHACAMRRCLEVLPGKKLFQVGIRSGTAKEFEEMKKYKRLIEHPIKQQTNNLRKALKPFLGFPIYLTIDLDWFDPSVLPGTGTPEPGGYFWNDFADIVNIIKDHNLVGADIVELSPHLDSSGASSIFAAKVARSLIILLNKSLDIQ